MASRYSKAAEVLGLGSAKVDEDIEKSRPKTAATVLPQSANLTDTERVLLWKQDLHILPLSAAAYFLCCLDGSNIGNARILNSSTHDDMMSETHMSSYEYSIVLVAFLTANSLFGVPSSILLRQLRPSRWIALLMFAWGAVSMAHGAAQNYIAVAVMRVLLGILEAGLPSGLVYYLTFWYRAQERSLRVTLIFASAALAGAIGGAVAFGVGHMNQARDISAWRWLFAVEGLPSCLSAFFVLFFLPDYPEDAAWLSKEQKRLTLYRLRADGSRARANSPTWQEAKAILLDWPLYGHYLIYCAMSTPSTSLSLFMPSIIASLGYADISAQLMTIPPYAVASVLTIITCWSASRFNARGLHAATLAMAGAIGFLASAVLPADSYLSRYGCLILAVSGSFACIPPLVGWLSSSNLSPSATGLVMAISLSLGGAPGQLAGVWIYKSDEAASGFTTGHWVNAAMLIVASVGCVLMRIYYGRRNRWIQKSAASPGSEVSLFVY